MAEIISIDDASVSIGADDGKIVKVSIASIKYANPKVGDEVKLYSDDNNYIVKKSSNTVQTEGVKKVNKNLHVWVFSFLLGGLGVDRFVRGQIGVGICKLLFDWLTLGVWAVVDWIIAMVKAYGQSFGQDEDFSSDIRGRYTK